VTILNPKTLSTGSPLKPKNPKTTTIDTHATSTKDGVPVSAYECVYLVLVV